MDERLIHGLRNLLLDRDSDQAFLAMALALPSENWIGQQMAVLDPVAVCKVRQQFRALIARTLCIDLVQCYDRLYSAEPYRYSAPEADAARCATPAPPISLPPLAGELEPCLLQRGINQYRQADNMTDAIAVLGALVNADLTTGTELLVDFHAKWQHDPLVVDKWLILQAGCTLPGTLDRVKALTSHPSFTYKNPNKVRSLIATFCATNHVHFHAADGSGYQFLGDQICLLDQLNPQIASRMITPLTQWRRYDQSRQQLMRAQLGTYRQPADSFR